jgi:hypothetical protein
VLVAEGGVREHVVARDAEDTVSSFLNSSSRSLNPIAWMVHAGVPSFG